MKRNQVSADFHSPGHQVGDVSRGSGDWLVDYDVAASSKSFLGVGDVPIVGGCDDDEFEGWVAEHGFEGRVSGDPGVGRFGIARFALDDCGQFQAFDCGDQWGVKDLAC